MNTTYLAGAVLLAFRLTTCTSSGPSYKVWPGDNVTECPTSDLHHNRAFQDVDQRLRMMRMRPGSILLAGTRL